MTITQAGNNLDTFSDFASDINDIVEEETIPTPSHQGVYYQFCRLVDVTVFNDLSHLQVVVLEEASLFSANANWTVLHTNGVKCSKNKS